MHLILSEKRSVNETVIFSSIDHSISILSDHAISVRTDYCFLNDTGPFQKSTYFIIVVNLNRNKVVSATDFCTSPKEVAKTLEISVATLYRWIPASGKLIMPG